jgi:glycosyltransferase involved in cell wall biosynthesis
LVSVVMPVFNGEDFVRSSVESVLAQTLQDFEFIIVDDHSDDSTPDLLAALTDTRITVLRNGGQKGVSPASNLAMKAARGRYIARMDCDDLCATERLEKQVAFLEAHPGVGVCGTFQEIFGGYRDGYSRTAVTDAEIRVGLLFGPTMKQSTVMFRTSVVREHGLYYDLDLRYGEDYDLWVRASKVTQLHNLPEYLCRYRWESKKLWETTHPAVTDLLNAIWSRQFLELGLDLGARDLVLLGLLLGLGAFGDESDLISGGDLLKRILEANRRTKAYDGAVLARRSSEIWRNACRSLARRSWRAAAAYAAALLAPGLLWIP